MSKSKLRKEHEAMFGVVEGALRLYDANGNMIYHEISRGWLKYQYDAEGNVIYKENSIMGVTLDERPSAGSSFWRKMWQIR